MIQLLIAYLLPQGSNVEEAFQYSTVRYVKKGDYMLTIGEYCRFIGFINYGVFTGTIIDQVGKEIACNFLFENSFFTYTEGISSNVPSRKNFIALKDCKMLIVEKEKQLQ